MAKTTQVSYAKSKVLEAASILGHQGGIAAMEQKKGIFSPAYKKRLASKKKKVSVTKKKIAKKK